MNHPKILAVIPVYGRTSLLPFTIKRLLEKNKLFKVICCGNKEEDKIEYKNISNIIKRLKRIENYKNDINSFNGCENSRQKWNVAKQHLYGKGRSHIERIIENGSVKIGSKKVASAFNRYFITKVRKIREGLPPTNKDPMDDFAKFIKKPKKKLNFEQINMSQLKNQINKMKK